MVLPGRRDLNDIERPLPGGFVSTVVRLGDTVRRTPPPNAPFTHRLLDHLAARGFDGAPRFLGFDDAGRQTLTFLPGHVAWRAEQPDDVTSADSLRAVARLTRRLHDLTANTDLAGDAAVVCHNDLSPKNTVYRDTGAGLRPVAFIDWDIAAPGERVHDLAHVCWQYLGLGPACGDPVAAARGVEVIAKAYGPGDYDHAKLIDTVLWWQDRCWRGIAAAAHGGDAAMIRLRDSGAVTEVRAAFDWVSAHRVRLIAELDG